MIHNRIATRLLRDGRFYELHLGARAE